MEAAKSERALALTKILNDLDVKGMVSGLPHELGRPRCVMVTVLDETHDDVATLVVCIDRSWWDEGTEGENAYHETTEFAIKSSELVPWTAPVEVVDLLERKIAECLGRFRAVGFFANDDARRRHGIECSLGVK